MNTLPQDKKAPQVNIVTGKAYQGDNQLRLRIIADENNFTSNKWMTFLQAKELGLKIKKGSKAVKVFKGFSTMDIKDKKTDKVTTKPVVLENASVFNKDQTEEIEK